MTATLLTTLISLQTGGSVSHKMEREMIAWHFVYERYYVLDLFYQYIYQAHTHYV